MGTSPLIVKSLVQKIKRVNKFFFFFSSRRRHTRWNCDWSSDVCSSDLPAHGVDLVDEDDAGRVLLALLEQVAHAARADAHEHLDEVGARDREERHARFAREIGRASCRERVEISVGAGCLKKKYRKSQTG